MQQDASTLSMAAMHQLMAGTDSPVRSTSNAEGAEYLQIVWLARWFILPGWTRSTWRDGFRSVWAIYTWDTLLTTEQVEDKFDRSGSVT